MRSRGFGSFEAASRFVGRLKSSATIFATVPSQSRRYPYRNNAVCSDSGFVPCKVGCWQSSKLPIKGSVYPNRPRRSCVLRVLTLPVRRAYLMAGMVPISSTPPSSALYWLPALRVIRATPPWFVTSASYPAFGVSPVIRCAFVSGGTS